MSATVIRRIAVAVTALFLFSTALAVAQSPTTVYLPYVVRSDYPPFGYGANVAVPNMTAKYLAPMGFNWVKYHIKWADDERQEGVYNWADDGEFPADSYAGNYVRDTPDGFNILLRVDSPPSWASAGDRCAPYEYWKFERFMTALSSYLKTAHPTKTVAYEIWNEPNLHIEWCNQPPNPEQYVQLLAAGYRGVKAGNPDAVVVSAGLATTGVNDSEAMNDITFIERMYSAGAAQYFDALGSHPYGFGSQPEDPTGVGDVLYFQRARAQHDVMLRYGDTKKQIWATEFGWPVRPSTEGFTPDEDKQYLQNHEWFAVSPDDQASRLQRAYSYAYANWPWMGPMFVFNLDFPDVSWMTYRDPMYWYAVTKDDGTTGNEVLIPRPAYEALKAMPKPTQR